MKTMTKLTCIAAAIAAAILTSSCSKAAEDEANIIGEWHLTGIEVPTKVEEPYGLSVYISFSEDSSFEIYEKLQEGRYRKYNGNYNLKDNVLTGTYSDDSPLNGVSYKVKTSGNTLTLTQSDTPNEVTTYIRESIPEEVRETAIEGIQ